MARKLNLVFQGGGVRGIAYAGALASLPDDIEINAVAGASAGSIVAALLAIGKSKREIKNVLEDPELFNLLEKDQTERAQRIKEAAEGLKPIWEQAARKGKISWPQLLRWRWRHGGALADLAAVWRSRGLHSSDRLGKWLTKVLEDKSFADIRVADLKIVAADVSERKYVIYSKKDGGKLAEAVRASASIPIFFQPFPDKSKCLVDGGLLSNFPSFLFAQGDEKGRYPTIGFRLEDIEPPGPFNDSPLAFLSGLLRTMTEAHDKERERPPDYREYFIPTPPEIPGTKFALTGTDVKELYRIGELVGQTVEWQKYSREVPAYEFYEPKSQLALDFSIKQGYELLQSLTHRSMWLDSLSQTTEFQVRIEKDWSSQYDRTFEFEVKGPKYLLAQRLKTADVPHGKAGPQSLLDIAFTCEELCADGTRKDLIRIPAFNSAQTKGFAVFYAPPVMEGLRRRFHTSFRGEREFDTGSERFRGTISYGVQRRAIQHKLKLTVRILVDIELPDTRFETVAGSPTTSAAAALVDGRYYRSYAWEFAEADVGDAESVVEIEIWRQ